MLEQYEDVLVFDAGIGIEVVSDSRRKRTELHSQESEHTRPDFTLA